MLDELKILVDMLGNVDDIALYIIGGFAVYKLIIYLSGVGAAVMLAKLFIVKVHDIWTQPAVITERVQIGNVFIDKEDWEDVKEELKKYRTTNYIHTSDTVKIIKALREGRKDD